MGLALLAHVTDWACRLSECVLLPLVDVLITAFETVFAVFRGLLELLEIKEVQDQWLVI